MMDMIRRSEEAEEALVWVNNGPGDTLGVAGEQDHAADHT